MPELKVCLNDNEIEILQNLISKRVDEIDELLKNCESDRDDFDLQLESQTLEDIYWNIKMQILEHEYDDTSAID